MAAAHVDSLSKGVLVTQLVCCEVIRARQQAMLEAVTLVCGRPISTMLVPYLRSPLFDRERLGTNSLLLDMT